MYFSQQSGVSWEGRRDESKSSNDTLGRWPYFPGDGVAVSREARGPLWLLGTYPRSSWDFLLATKLVTLILWLLARRRTNHPHGRVCETLSEAFPKPGGLSSPEPVPALPRSRLRDFPGHLPGPGPGAVFSPPRFSLLALAWDGGRSALHPRQRRPPASPVPLGGVRHEASQTPASLPAPLRPPGRRVPGRAAAAAAAGGGRVLAPDGAPRRGDARPRRRLPPRCLRPRGGAAGRGARLLLLPPPPPPEQREPPAERGVPGPRRRPVSQSAGGAGGEGNAGGMEPVAGEEVEEEEAEAAGLRLLLCGRKVSVRLGGACLPEEEEAEPPPPSSAAGRGGFRRRSPCGAPPAPGGFGGG